MRLVCGLAILGFCSGVLALAAQPPGERLPDEPKKVAKDDKAKLPAVNSIIERLMVYDKNKDGKLTKEEVTDRRLQRLFERADTNKDGIVTKEELTALAESMVDEAQAAGPRGGFGPPGAPPGGPPGGPGPFGSGGFGPPSPPGQILPTFLQDRLKLTPDQKKQVDALQVEVDAKLAKILTAEQKKQLKEMRDRFGRGGPGGRGGPPGGRGRGGPPPDDGKGPPRPPQ